MTAPNELCGFNVAPPKIGFSLMGWGIGAFTSNCKVQFSQDVPLNRIDRNHAIDTIAREFLIILRAALNLVN